MFLGSIIKVNHEGGSHQKAVHEVIQPHFFPPAGIRRQSCGKNLFRSSWSWRSCKLHLRNLTETISVPVPSMHRASYAGLPRKAQMPLFEMPGVYIERAEPKRSGTWRAEFESKPKPLRASDWSRTMEPPCLKCEGEGPYVLRPGINKVHRFTLNPPGSFCPPFRSNAATSPPRQPIG